MTLKECIDRVDSVKPNQYSIEQKVAWLSYIDGIIKNDVIDTHELPDGWEEFEFMAYNPDDLTKGLLIPAPYDELYVAYIKMRIDEENGETARYNNSSAMFNAYMDDLAKAWNRQFVPKYNGKLRIF